jgi:hypothetical protein
MDFSHLTAPCGLPCFACYMYLANEDEAKRHLVAQVLELPLEQSVCPGCRNTHGHPAHLPMSCRVYPCAADRRVHVCSDCQDFPCDFLHPYRDNAKLLHNTKVFNLCLIKKMGLEAWAQHKAKKVLEDYFYGEWTL